MAIPSTLRVTFIINTLMILNGSVCAQLFLHENFNYNEGNAHGVAATGVGLSGNFLASAHGDTTNATAEFEATSLYIPGHFPVSGGSLKVSNAGPDWGSGGLSSALALPTFDASTTSLWSSMIMQVSSSDGVYYNDWVVETRLTTAPNANHSPSLARVQARSFNSGSSPEGKAGVSTNVSEITEGAGTVSPFTNYLFVTHYTLSSSDLTAATLYAFDPTAYADYLLAANAAPASAEILLATHASVTLTDNDTQRMNPTSIQFSINGGATGQYDDIRLGSTLWDVVNVNAVPEPSTLIGSFLGLFGMLMFRRR